MDPDTSPADHRHGATHSMTPTGFTKDGLEFCTIEDEDIRLCVCPRMGGEMSSLQFKKLLPGHELLFRGE